MPDRWIEIRTLTGAAEGCIVAVLHVPHPTGDTAWPCGHLHTWERTALACVAERWPGVEVRTANPNEGEPND